jgi:hypothetical protein
VRGEPAALVQARAEPVGLLLGEVALGDRPVDALLGDGGSRPLLAIA